MTGIPSKAPLPDGPLAGATEAFAMAFDAWAPEASRRPFPFSAAVAAYREHGKHFVPDAVTGRMARLRRTAVRPGSDPRHHALLEAFLDTALDKAEGRYDYGTYCGLKVLDLPQGSQMALSCARITEARDRAVCTLLADLLRFECGAAGEAAAFLPILPPEPVLRTRRLRSVLSAMRPALDRMGWRQTGGTPVEQVAADVLAWLEPGQDDDTRLRLQMSILPVHKVHDEYLFLRVLQSFEVNFAWLAVRMRRAIDTMIPAPEQALSEMQRANAIQREAARLFPVLASMQPEAFRDFRRYTEGASAIQSAGYKTVEALCRTPDADRLDSAAFASVPEVKSAAASGQVTLEDAFAAACRNNRFGAHHRRAMEEEMRGFARQLKRWRQAHYALARRYLGERTGTGYTEGVPYLERVRGIPVFRSLDEPDQ